MGFFKADTVDATVNQARPTADNGLFIMKIPSSRMSFTEVEFENLKPGMTSTFMYYYESFIESRISP